MTVKTKSVCCSGTKSRFVCDPFRNPTPVSPPDPIAISACSRLWSASALTLVGSRNAWRRSIWYSRTRPTWKPATISTTAVSASTARYRARAPATTSIPTRIATKTIEDPRSGWRNTRNAGIAARPGGSEHVLEREVAAQLGQERREHRDQGELGDLGGGELEAEELEPALRALDARAERRPDQHEQHERGHVDHPGVDLQQPVVEAQRQHQHDRAHRQERELALHEPAGVQVHGRERLVGGRVDREQADHREPDRRRQQDRVDVAERVPLPATTRPVASSISRSPPHR